MSDGLPFLPDEAWAVQPAPLTKVCQIGTAEFMGGRIGIYGDSENPWFAAAEVCRALGLPRLQEQINSVPEKHKILADVMSLLPTSHSRCDVDTIHITSRKKKRKTQRAWAEQNLSGVRELKAIQQQIFRSVESHRYAAVTDRPLHNAATTSTNGTTQPA